MLSREPLPPPAVRYQLDHDLEVEADAAQLRALLVQLLGCVPPARGPRHTRTHSWRRVGVQPVPPQRIYRVATHFAAQTVQFGAKMD